MNSTKAYQYTCQRTAYMREACQAFKTAYLAEALQISPVAVNDFKAKRSDFLSCVNYNALKRLLLDWASHASATLKHRQPNDCAVIMYGLLKNHTREYIKSNFMMSSHSISSTLNSRVPRKFAAVVRNHILSVAENINNNLGA